jgi:hypothetical protein
MYENWTMRCTHAYRKDTVRLHAASRHSLESDGGNQGLDLTTSLRYESGLILILLAVFVFQFELAVHNDNGSGFIHLDNLWQE